MDMDIDIKIQNVDKKLLKFERYITPRFYSLHKFKNAYCLQLSSFVVYKMFEFATNFYHFKA